MADAKKSTGGSTDSKKSKPVGDIGSDIGEKGKPGNVTGGKASTAKSKAPGGDYDKVSTKE